MFEYILWFVVHSTAASFTLTDQLGLSTYNSSCYTKDNFNQRKKLQLIKETLRMRAMCGEKETTCDFEQYLTFLPFLLTEHFLRTHLPVISSFHFIPSCKTVKLLLSIVYAFIHENVNSNLPNSPNPTKSSHNFNHLKV